VAPRGAPPADLVELGSVRGAYGVRGWVRVAPHAVDGHVLGEVEHWWLTTAGRTTRVTASERRRHRTEWLAKWAGCETKEDADALKGAGVAVERSRFPALGPGEHYLADLVGSRVVNRSGDALGNVTGLRANDVAGVSRQWLEVQDGDALRLIPLVEAYVDSVDAAGRVVRVDWQRDW
jgi:16S rRNA processing protein RimM